MIARVAVFAPVPRTFDYRVPPALTTGLTVGARVWAPFGGRALEIGKRRVGKECW